MTSIPKSGVEIPLTFIRTGQIAAEIYLFQEERTVLIDTGSSRTVLHKAIVEANGIALHKSDTTGGGVGGLNLPLYDLDNILASMGDHDWLIEKPNAMDLSHVIEALKNTSCENLVGVLGADVLLRYEAVIDYKSCKLTLKPEG